MPNASLSYNSLIFTGYSHVVSVIFGILPGFAMHRVKKPDSHYRAVNSARLTARSVKAARYLMTRNGIHFDPMRILHLLTLF